MCQNLYLIMKEYKIFWKKSALKELNDLPHNISKKIYDEISSLINNPRPHNSKKLINLNDYYRIRIQDYRVIYSIHDNELIIQIIRIAHRKDVYKQ